MNILRSEFARWFLLSLAVVAFGIVGQVRTPGTDAATVGEIAGFGSRMDGKQCYLTLGYTVRGADYRLQSSHERRWCDYEPLYRRHGSVIVYYDSSDPGTATLTRRGSTPVAATVIGLAGVAACCLLRVRRPGQRTGPPQSPSVSAVTAV